MDKQLTLWDRMVYGSIAAAFGTLLGLGASLCLLLALGSSTPIKSIVLVSAAYFFAIGLVRGVGAADITGEATGAVMGVALAESGAMFGPPENSDSPWAKWSSPVLLLVWVAIVACLAWVL